MSDEPEVTTTLVEDVRVVRVSGEFDPDEAATLTEALAVPSGGAALGLVVDLAHVAFADSSFLHALIDARLRHRDARVPLVLAAPGPLVVRLLELTDTARVFTITPTVEAAVEAVRGARADGRSLR
ncbi:MULTISPECIES: STAS domain-containing protein [Streptomyces]|uniref:STAS domain-containing protein n=1 Tax=Streptomyces lichenis TaxID=2306967 RepID=A0ABT0I8Y2_9ACTN|nr:STAS domain-containing protein [Streptomyces lichenis]MCK8677768.1 STAS domain-containing protein [Streptomyces lichenis]